MLYIPADFATSEEVASAQAQGCTINVRLCRDCEYFVPEVPTIDVDGDFGYCEFKTDFKTFEDAPIDWYFTDRNGFCNEEDLIESAGI